jgi:hypothetical protein
MRYALAVAILAGVETLAAIASADRGDTITTTTPGSDKKGTSATESGAEEKPSPWRGSVLLFDQSVTTQTIGLGADYQSSDPTYELWFALKPRYTYYQNETKTTTLSASLWSNLYIELTNSDSTTTEHEPVLGPTFLSTSLSQVVYARDDGTKTSFNLGPRLTLPTDKESRASGRYFSMGAMAGLSQAITLNGKDAPAFNGLTFGISSIYAHPFNRAIVPTTTNDAITGLPRQTTAPKTTQIGDRLVADYSTGSDALRSGMNVKDSISVSFSGGAQLTPKLSLGLSYVISNSWTYWPSPLTSFQTPTGTASVQSIDNPTNHRVGTWALASVDYDLVDEMSVGVGYYNQTNQIGPDGQRRGPLWSPDARVFLTLTGNLDVIAKDLFSKPPPPAQTASAK